MKSRISRNVLIGMWGSAVCLFAIIIILAPYTSLSFISTGITAAFGFIGFWILIPFLFFTGVSMIFHKALVKVKFGISMWGILIIIFAFTILTSHWGSIGQTVDLHRILDGFTRDASGDPNYVTFGKSFDYFNQIASGTSYSPYSPVSGGGFVGYVLLGVLNSLISPIGMIILCWVLIVTGFMLVFHVQVRKLFRKIFRKGANKDTIKTESVSVEREPVIKEAPPIEAEQPSFVRKEEARPLPFEEDSVTREMMADFSMKNYNATHGLKKPILTLDNGVATTSSVDAFKPVQQFEQPQNVVSQTPVVETSIQQPRVEPLQQNLSASPVSNENVLGKPQPIPTPVVNQPQDVQNPLLTPAQAQPTQAEPIVDFLHRPQPKAVIRPPYVYPSIDLLDKHEGSDDASKNDESNESRSNLINTIFNDLNVGAQVVGFTVGPSVTRFDIQTSAHVSVNQINKFVNDISIRLGGIPTRFEPIVYGKPTSGLEIPNVIRTNVGLRESIEGLPAGDKYLCNIPFGKNISGELVQADMKEFPHLLVAGTTGSGKSIFVHSVIMTLIMRNSPSQLKLLLIDPKKVEMAYYRSIPHLLCPNISEPRQAYIAFKKLVDEMERRYNLFVSTSTRDIKTFNIYAKEHGLEPLPVIAVFIDEYADLSDQCKEIREPVVRIAQKARACGIHLVIATQRPSVNVIDGVIKANISSHVALMVASSTDSMTIIGEGGAEALLGNGDMLVDCPLLSRKQKTRVQGCFVDVPEILRVTDFLRSHYSEEYYPEFLDLTEKEEPKQTNSVPEVQINGKELAEEELYKTIKEDITQREYCSISYLTRAYAIGFPKAGRLFNKLIQDGYVASSGDAKGSKVLIHEAPQQQMGTIEQSEFIPNSMIDDGSDELNDEQSSYEDSME